jgi:hypothetical protein
VGPHIAPVLNDGLNLPRFSEATGLTRLLGAGLANGVTCLSWRVALFSLVMCMTRPTARFWYRWYSPAA